ncbi:MAG: hypothetical protein AB8H12_04715 [Lewinella sp.]
MHYLFKLLMAIMVMTLVFSCQEETDLFTPQEGRFQDSGFDLSIVPDGMSVFMPTVNDIQEVPTPAWMKRHGLFVDSRKGLKLKMVNELKGKYEAPQAYPVLDENRSLIGFYWKIHGAGDFHFVDNYTVIKNVTDAKVECESPVNLLVQMFYFIEVYEFHSVPHRAISNYLKKVHELDCPLEKDISYTVVGQYIEYDGGVPSAVVAFEYEVTELCTSIRDLDEWGDPGSGNGNNDDDPNDGSSPNSDNNDDDDDVDDVVKTPVETLREFLVDECGFNYNDFGRMNVAAGAAFEAAVLEAYGMTQNTQMFDSPVRDALTNGAHTKVQPDFVEDGLWVAPETGVFDFLEDYILGEDANDNIHVYEDMVFGEIKAYSSTVNLSTSDYQIQGEIDALAEEFSHLRDPSNGTFSPAYYLVTIGDVSDAITTYCNARGIQFFHVKVDINDRNQVDIQSIVQKNALGGDVNLSFRGRRVDLRCPPNSPRGRLDPEIMTGN